MPPRLNQKTHELFVLQGERKRLVLLGSLLLLATIGSALRLNSRPAMVGLEGRSIESVTTHLEVLESGIVRHHQQNVQHNGNKKYPLAIGIAAPTKAIGPYTPLAGIENNPKVEYSDLEFSVDGYQLNFIYSQGETGEDSLIQGVQAEGPPPQGKITTHLKFNMKNKLVHHQFFDELIWPVIGYRSALPIKKVGAVVTLPPGVMPENVSTKAYLRKAVRAIDRRPQGNYTSKAKYKVSTINYESGVRTVVQYWSTAPLEADELFFIQLRWPPGFVKD